MKAITHFQSVKSFETSRIIVRKLEAGDIDEILTMHANVKVMATIGGLRTEKQTRDYLNENLKHWGHHSYGLWMLYAKSTGEFIGRAALRHINLEGRDEVELAYALMPKFWNQGLATEVASAAVEIAFEVLRLPSLVCFTLTTNKASQHVMEKVGFAYVRDIIHADLPHMLYRLKNFIMPI